MNLILADWVSAKEMRGILAKHVACDSQFGDVYVKFRQPL